MSKYNWVLALFLVFAAAFASGCVGEEEMEEAAEGIEGAAQEATEDVEEAAEGAVATVEEAAGSVEEAASEH